MGGGEGLAGMGLSNYLLAFFMLIFYLEYIRNSKTDFSSQQSPSQIHLFGAVTLVDGLQRI